MSQPIFSTPKLTLKLQTLPPLLTLLLFAGYFCLNVAFTLLLVYSPLLGAGAILLFNLLLFLFLQPIWAIPLYILVAAPSIALPLGSAGIWSRLFAGNLVLALLLIVGCIRTLFTPHDTQTVLHTRELQTSLVAIVFVGGTSILYSRIQPDPGVIYAFPHSTVSLNIVNTMELVMLIGLPLLLLIAPTLIQAYQDVRWIIRSFCLLGVLYALGTIFAGPLKLYSQQTLLDIPRPQVFGTSSSILGFLMVFFVCVTLGQALYAQKRGVAYCWWLLTLFFSLAVIFSLGRTSWLTLCLAGLTMIGLRTKNLLTLPFVLLLILLAFVPGVSNFFNPDKVYGSDRLIMWQDALSIWLRHPYFGIGAGNYQFFDIAYGTDVGGVAHNQYLEVLAEMGVQGLLCLLWSVLAIGRLAWQRFQHAATPQGKALALSYLGYYCGLIFFGFFGDSFLPSVAGAGGTSALINASYNWLLLALVLTIPHWERSLLPHTDAEANT